MGTEQTRTSPHGDFADCAHYQRPHTTTACILLRSNKGDCCNLLQHSLPTAKTSTCCCIRRQLVPSITPPTAPAADKRTKERKTRHHLTSTATAPWHQQIPHHQQLLALKGQQQVA
jgi:hypothetical protein